MAVTESSGNGYALYNGVKVLASEVPEGADSIPLDGMTVIEWDGDTEGLVNMGVSYKVAEYENASSAVCVYSTGDVRSEITKSTENSWFVGEGTGAIHEEDVEAAGVPESGIYMGAGNGNYCSLLAYTPATTEPSTAKLHLTSMLMGWLVGRAVASQRGKGQVVPDAPVTPDEPEKQLIGYSYNGVVLPDINEVWTDELKAEYPYAVICYVDYAETLGIDIKGHILWCSDQPLTYDDTDSLWWQGETSGAVLKYCTSSVFPTQADIDALAASGVPTDGVTPGVWTSIRIDEYNSETYGMRFVGTPVWSNYDVLNEDGSIYLAASDPVPVYE